MDTGKGVKVRLRIRANVRGDGQLGGRIDWLDRWNIDCRKLRVLRGSRGRYRHWFRFLVLPISYKVFHLLDKDFHGGRF